MKTFVAQTADQWRKWLDEHHDSEREVWLIFYELQANRWDSSEQPSNSRLQPDEGAGHP